MIYGSLHTYFDYYAEHEFFMHRIQQVLLHHLAPLLVIASYPGAVMRAGLPLALACASARAAAELAAARGLAAMLLNPAVATITFVAFILVWLIPHMQTLAMLDWRIYRFMNWSMVISGFIYWWLVLDHRPRPPGRMTPGVRVLSPGDHDDPADRRRRHRHVLEDRPLSDLRDLRARLHLQRADRATGRRRDHVGAGGDHRIGRRVAGAAPVAAAVTQRAHPPRKRDAPRAPQAARA